MINILPYDDDKEHWESLDCPCEPSVEFNEGEMLITHNSYDGREGLEEVYVLLGLNPSELKGWIMRRTL